MSRTVFYTAATLDGFLADEHDSLAWLFKQEIDESGPMSYGEFIAGVGAGCLGWTTYDWVLDHEQGRWSYPDLPMWLFTHREVEPVPGVTVARGDVRPVHAAMVEAAAGKDVWVVGGGDLAAQFAEAGLLDRVMVSVAPVTLGAGRPLLPRPFDLRLDAVARNGAFACLEYDVVGPLTT
ncbi:dihydrofolate reductase family protein [Nocardioides taihuensis]|uniref:Dihydrofolate reductase family protein n=1 Tax=Nocardioides taihuensis TaxID=1835606 RepID=A0ABW0BLK1_9ACTN